MNDARTIELLNGILSQFQKELITYEDADSWDETDKMLNNEWDRAIDRCIELVETVRDHIGETPNDIKRESQQFAYHQGGD